MRPSNRNRFETCSLLPQLSPGSAPMAIVALVATVVSSFVANAIVPIRPLAFPSLAPASPPVLADTAARLAKFEENDENEDETFQLGENLTNDHLDRFVGATRSAQVAECPTAQAAARKWAAKWIRILDDQDLNDQDRRISIAEARIDSLEAKFDAWQTAYMFTGSFVVFLCFVKIMILSFVLGTTTMVL